MMFSYRIQPVFFDLRDGKSAKDPNQFYGLAIGFVIVAAGHAVGAVSGAALNPALALSLGNTSGKVGLEGPEKTGWDHLEGQL